MRKKNVNEKRFKKRASAREEKWKKKKGLKRRSKVNKKLRMKLKVFFPPFRVLHKKKFLALRVSPSPLCRRRCCSI
jgi:hypothetical protein